MNFEAWEDFTSSEKELFQRACRRLLKTTFIVRDRNDDSKKLYQRMSRHSVNIFHLWDLM